MDDFLSCMRFCAAKAGHFRLKKMWNQNHYSTAVLVGNDTFLTKNILKIKKDS